MEVGPTSNQPPIWEGPPPPPVEPAPAFGKIDPALEDRMRQIDHWINNYNSELSQYGPGDNDARVRLLQKKMDDLNALKDELKMGQKNPDEASEKMKEISNYTTKDL